MKYLIMEDFSGQPVPFIFTVDARSFLRRNGHGPAGRHPVAASARGVPPSNSPFPSALS